MEISPLLRIQSLKSNYNCCAAEFHLSFKTKPQLSLLSFLLQLSYVSFYSHQLHAVRILGKQSHLDSHMQILSCGEFRSLIYIS